MKINYKILWLDDQIDAFSDDEFIEKIQKHLEDKGFSPDIQTVPKVSDFFERLDNSFDFILTDYNMSEMNGAQVIKAIREQSIFTEILFYTAQPQWEEIGRLERISFLQTKNVSGTTHHQQVIDKAINIIDLTIRKFQHIVAMRGMIMHEVSSLDAQMLEIVSTYLQNNDEDKQQPIINRVLKDLTRHHEEKLMESKKIQDNNRFDKIINDPLLFSSSQRASAIEAIINSIGIKNFINDFKEEIIKVRNDFAHAVLVKDLETGEEFFQNKNSRIAFNDEKCIAIRKNINKHKQNLDDLQSNINNQNIIPKT
ncbi:MAG: response regulator [Mycoplasmataceae bacterium]|jgi:CheY-like chemotaxis protein|nr:response regulator [Mycoplasmataceae bacterium]